jgi:hypothetical protein
VSRTAVRYRQVRVVASPSLQPLGGRQCRSSSLRAADAALRSGRSTLTPARAAAQILAPIRTTHKSTPQPEILSRERIVSTSKNPSLASGNTLSAAHHAQPGQGFPQLIDNLEREGK